MGKLKELALGEGGSCLDASQLSSALGALGDRGCSINGISDIQKPPKCRRMAVCCRAGSELALGED